MLAVVLNDALIFAATPDLAATLLANRHFSAVAAGIVARRTLRAVWIRQGSPQAHISTAFLTPTGSTSFQAVTLSASDDVDNALRPLRLGGIVEVFRLQTRALADRWFVDVLSSVVVGGIVSQTLRLHLSNESIYALAVEVHYDKAWLLDFKVVDHDAHRAKCEKLGIRQVQFFDNGILTAPREVPLGIQRIVAVQVKAPSTYGLGVHLSMDNLFAAYRKEFVEISGKAVQCLRISRGPCTPYSPDLLKCAHAELRPLVFLRIHCGPRQTEGLRGEARKRLFDVGLQRRTGKVEARIVRLNDDRVESSLRQTVTIV